MKIIVSSGALLSELQLAGGAISSNPVMPILEDFLFSLRDGKLFISATDIETSLSTYLTISESEGEGSIAVPARILMDTLKALPEQPITIEIEEETYGITLISSYGKYRLAGEDGEDYPEIPQLEDLPTLKVDATHLADAIKSTLFATSTDDMRPAMTGVYMMIEDSRITAVATDAHKLVKFNFSPTENSDATSTSFIVPRKCLSLLKSALPDDGAITLGFNRENAFFQFDDTTVVCRLIDYRYPDYEAVIPTDNPNKLTIDRVRLQNSLKRIAIYSNKSTNQVIWQVSPGSLTLSTQDIDFSNEATEQLPCNYDGEPLEIAFNARFLIEMLGVLDTEEVIFELADAKRAAILLPVDDKRDTKVLMLVMPVMITN